MPLGSQAAELTRSQMARPDRFFAVKPGTRFLKYCQQNAIAAVGKSARVATAPPG
jgi:hypothetical protein